MTIKEWEEIDKSNWQAQEIFVRKLIKTADRYRQALEFLRDERYAGHSGFKHTEGTVGSYITELLAGGE